MLCCYDTKAFARIVQKDDYPDWGGSQAHAFSMETSFEGKPSFDNHFGHLLCTRDDCFVIARRAMEWLYVGDRLPQVVKQSRRFIVRKEKIEERKKKKKKERQKGLMRQQIELVSAMRDTVTAHERLHRRLMCSVNAIAATSALSVNTREEICTPLTLPKIAPLSYVRTFRFRLGLTKLSPSVEVPKRGSLNYEVHRDEALIVDMQFSEWVRAKKIRKFERMFGHLRQLQRCIAGLWIAYNERTSRMIAQEKVKGCFSAVVLPEMLVKSSGHEGWLVTAQKTELACLMAEAMEDNINAVEVPVSHGSRTDERRVWGAGLCWRGLPGSKIEKMYMKEKKRIKKEGGNIKDACRVATKENVEKQFEEYIEHFSHGLKVLAETKIRYTLQEDGDFHVFEVCRPLIGIDEEKRKKTEAWKTCIDFYNELIETSNYTTRTTGLVTMVRAVVPQIKEIVVAESYVRGSGHCWMKLPGAECFPFDFAEENVTVAMLYEEMYENYMNDSDGDYDCFIKYEEEWNGDLHIIDVCGYDPENADYLELGDFIDKLDAYMRQERMKKKTLVRGNGSCWQKLSPSVVAYKEVEDNGVVSNDCTIDEYVDLMKKVAFDHSVANDRSAYHKTNLRLKMERADDGDLHLCDVVETTRNTFLDCRTGQKYDKSYVKIETMIEALEKMIKSVRRQVMIGGSGECWLDLPYISHLYDLAEEIRAEQNITDVDFKVVTTAMAHDRILDALEEKTEGESDEDCHNRVEYCLHNTFVHWELDADGDIHILTEGGYRETLAQFLSLLREWQFVDGGRERLVGSEEGAPSTTLPVNTAVDVAIDACVPHFLVNLPGLLANVVKSLWAHYVPDVGILFKGLSFDDTFTHRLMHALLADKWDMICWWMYNFGDWLIYGEGQHGARIPVISHPEDMLPDAYEVVLEQSGLTIGSHMLADLLLGLHTVHYGTIFAKLLAYITMNSKEYHGPNTCYREMVYAGKMTMFADSMAGERHIVNTNAYEVPRRLMRLNEAMEDYSADNAPKNAVMACARAKLAGVITQINEAPNVILPMNTNDEVVDTLQEKAPEFNIVRGDCKNVHGVLAGARRIVRKRAFDQLSSNRRPVLAIGASVEECALIPGIVRNCAPVLSGRDDYRHNHRTVGGAPAINVPVKFEDYQEGTEDGADIWSSFSAMDIQPTKFIRRMAIGGHRRAILIMMMPFALLDRRVTEFVDPLLGVKYKVEGDKIAMFHLEGHSAGYVNDRECMMSWMTNLPTFDGLHVQLEEIVSIGTMYAMELTIGEGKQETIPCAFKNFAEPMYLLPEMANEMIHNDDHRMFAISARRFEQLVGYAASLPKNQRLVQELMPKARGMLAEIKIGRNTVERRWDVTILQLYSLCQHALLCHDLYYASSVDQAKKIKRYYARQEWRYGGLIYRFTQRTLDMFCWRLKGERYPLQNGSRRWKLFDNSTDQTETMNPYVRIDHFYKINAGLTQVTAAPVEDVKILWHKARRRYESMKRTAKITYEKWRLMAVKPLKEEEEPVIAVNEHAESLMHIEQRLTNHDRAVDRINYDNDVFNAEVEDYEDAAYQTIPPCSTIAGSDASSETSIMLEYVTTSDSSSVDEEQYVGENDNAHQSVSCGDQESVGNEKCVNGSAVRTNVCDSMLSGDCRRVDEQKENDITKENSENSDLMSDGDCESTEDKGNARSVENSDLMSDSSSKSAEDKENVRPVNRLPTSQDDDPDENVRKYLAQFGPSMEASEKELDVYTVGHTGVDLELEPDARLYENGLETELTMKGAAVWLKQRCSDPLSTTSEWHLSEDYEVGDDDVFKNIQSKFAESVPDFKKARFCMTRVEGPAGCGKSTSIRNIVAQLPELTKINVVVPSKRLREDWTDKRYRVSYRDHNNFVTASICIIDESYVWSLSELHSWMRIASAHGAEHVILCGDHRQAYDTTIMHNFDDVTTLIYQYSNSVPRDAARLAKIRTKSKMETSVFFIIANPRFFPGFEWLLGFKSEEYDLNSIGQVQGKRLKDVAISGFKMARALKTRKGMRTVLLTRHTGRLFIFCRNKREAEALAGDHTLVSTQFVGAESRRIAMMLQIRDIIIKPEALSTEHEALLAEMRAWTDSTLSHEAAYTLMKHPEPAPREIEQVHHVPVERLDYELAEVSNIMPVSMTEQTYEMSPVKGMLCSIPFVEDIKVKHNHHFDMLEGSVATQTSTAAMEAFRNLIDRQLSNKKGAELKKKDVIDGIKLYRRFKHCFGRDKKEVFKFATDLDWFTSRTKQQLAGISGEIFGETGSSLRCKCHLKTQSKFKAEPCFGATKWYGQSIIACSKCFNAHFGPAVREAYFNMPDMLRPEVILDYGMTNAQLSERVMPYMDKLSSHRNIQIDVSKQDSSHNAPLLVAFILLLRDVGFPEKLAELYLAYCSEYHVANISDDHCRGKISYNLGSGDPFTLLRNCIMELTTVADRYRSADTLVCVAKGDDLLGHMKHYGLSGRRTGACDHVKLKIGIGEAPYFCGRFYIGDRFVVDPVRAIMKLSANIKNDSVSVEELHEGFRSRGIDYNANEQEVLLVGCRLLYPHLSEGLISACIDMVPSLSDLNAFKRYVKTNEFSYVRIVSSQRNCLRDCVAALRPGQTKQYYNQFVGLTRRNARRLLLDEGFKVGGPITTMSDAETNVIYMDNDHACTYVEVEPERRLVIQCV